MVNPGVKVPRPIETRNKVHACMAHRWNKTKKKTVLRIRLGRDQGRSRCLVALSKRWKLALISRSVSSHRRAGNKTQNRSAALQPTVSPGTADREINGLIDVLATRTPSAALQTSVPESAMRVWQARAECVLFSLKRIEDCLVF